MPSMRVRHLYNGFILASGFVVVSDAHQYDSSSTLNTSGMAGIYTVLTLKMPDGLQACTVNSVSEKGIVKLDTIQAVSYRRLRLFYCLEKMRNIN